MGFVWLLGRPSPLLPLRELRQVEGRPGALCRRPCPGTSTIPALLQLEYTARLPSRPSRTTPTLFSHPSHPKFRFYSATKRREDRLSNPFFFWVRYPLVRGAEPFLSPLIHSLTHPVVHIHDETLRNSGHKLVTPGSHPRRLVLPAQMGIQCSQCSLNYCTQRIDGAAGESLM